MAWNNNAFYIVVCQVYGENSKDAINSTVTVVCLKFLGLAIAAFLATFIGVSSETETISKLIHSHDHVHHKETLY